MSLQRLPVAHTNTRMHRLNFALLSDLEARSAVQISALVQVQATQATGHRQVLQLCFGCSAGICLRPAQSLSSFPRFRRGGFGGQGVAVWPLYYTIRHQPTCIKIISAMLDRVVQLRPCRVGIRSQKIAAGEVAKSPLIRKVCGHNSKA